MFYIYICRKGNLEGVQWKPQLMCLHAAGCKDAIQYLSVEKSINARRYICTILGRLGLCKVELEMHLSFALSDYMARPTWIGVTEPLTETDKNMLLRSVIIAVYIL